MAELPVLKTERLVLRPLRIEDAEAMHHFFSDEKAMTWWSSGPHETLEETRAYVRVNATDTKYLTWVITENCGDALGWVCLIPGREGVAEIGYNLRRTHWRKGYVGEAVSRVIDHCFGERGLHRLTADTDPDNMGSNALLEKLGFQREGYLREEWTTHLGLRDSIIWGLLKREWKPS
ncbi:GNAT family N-acetyltransferase [Parasphingopyxis lamellibrachiae]|uniref:RimJ/RimL family protein N-acetyltransferase n=1 Tax=Parasphingopyxis lamellibrachiae TaxID=680125 RepID=A0A3D9FC99_9SPHN|nr:GNAT family N-acetyltransferase [Parasphingopyxis lamellibrachiae]RED15222.1 RimJ/RimL family protein N-acetyltransferase [Parasphingopyxis lamellibrachiae]